MKDVIYILVILSLLAIIYHKPVEVVVYKDRIIEVEKVVTEYQQLDPITEVKTKIEIKYETITDTIIVLPDSVKWQWINAELTRLYPDR